MLPMSDGGRPELFSTDDDMRRSSRRVLAVWVLTLAGLYAFQAWFS
jgi:hypothetical protein